LILFLITVIFIFGLTACLRQKPPLEKIYTILEQAAMIEKDFEQVQDPLVAAEKKEKEVYDKIIELDSNQDEEKVKLSNEALTLVKERKKYMETETKSLLSSKKEFKKVASLKKSIEDEKIKNQANDLYNLMMNRYKAHDALSKSYLNEAAQDQLLYEMFTDKNVSVENQEAQVEKINRMYKGIYKANDRFNLLTRQYNDKKLQFYKTAGLIKE
jgi:hypothetical protein